MTLTEHFLAPEMRPFAIAAMMIVLIGGAEAIFMLIGASLSDMLGNAIGFDAHPDHGAFNVISWINVGGVPLLIFILLLLGLFSIAGFLIQDIARMFGAALPTVIAAPAALAVAIPLVRASSRVVAKAIPRDESYSIDLAELVGRLGEVVVGPLDHGLPGRVRVKDVHGNLHFVAACAAPTSPPLPQGSAVLLVDRSDGHFVAVAAPEELSHHPLSQKS